MKIASLTPSTITSAHQPMSKLPPFFIRLKAPLIHVSAGIAWQSVAENKYHLSSSSMTQDKYFAGDNNTSFRWCKLLTGRNKNGKLLVGPAYPQMGSQVNSSTATYHVEVARGGRTNTSVETGNGLEWSVFFVASSLEKYLCRNRTTCCMLQTESAKCSR